MEVETYFVYFICFLIKFFLKFYNAHSFWINNFLGLSGRSRRFEERKNVKWSNIASYVRQKNCPLSPIVHRTKKNISLLLRILFFKINFSFFKYSKNEFILKIYSVLKGQYRDYFHSCNIKTTSRYVWITFCSQHALYVVSLFKTFKPQIWKINSQ